MNDQIDINKFIIDWLMFIFFAICFSCIMIAVPLVLILESLAIVLVEIIIFVFKFIHRILKKGFSYVISSSV